MDIFSGPDQITILACAIILAGLFIYFYFKRQHHLIKNASFLASFFLRTGSFCSLLAFRYLVALLDSSSKRVISKKIQSNKNFVDDFEEKQNLRKRHLIRIIRFDQLQSSRSLLKNRLKREYPLLHKHILSKELASLQHCLDTLALSPIAPSMPVIEVVAVAFERFGELKVFVQSWINQTESNWRLKVLHDGFNEEFETIMQEFQKVCPEQISYFCTTERYNDYGHTLRHMGINQASSDFILLTNADNYFIPKAMAFINEKFLEENFEIDVLLFNMVHSHEWPGNTFSPSYSFFDVKLERGKVDVSSAIVKTELAKKAGFRDKTHDGDATYFEDIMALSGSDQPLNVLKVPNILFVHN